jgi:hypothetical protein
MKQLQTLARFHLLYAGMMACAILLDLLHKIYGPKINSVPWANPSEPRDTLLLGYFAMANVCNVLSALSFRATKHRSFSVFVAWFNCTAVPLGAILGVFTLRILKRSSVQAAYQLPCPKQNL